MEPIPPLSADPEFRPAGSERSLPPVVDPAAYRRVLANPFLGLLGIGAWVATVRQVLLASSDDPPSLLLWLGVLALGVFLIPRLFQYHCLDCGRTGRLDRWKRHVCPAVARRILEGRPLRFRGPGPLPQVLLWGYLLAAVLMLASVFGFSSR